MEYTNEFLQLRAKWSRHANRHESYIEAIVNNTLAYSLEHVLVKMFI